MADSTAAEQAIRDLFRRYEKCLNTSSLDEVNDLYTTKSICLFPGSQPHIGHSAVLKAYEKLFGEVDHKVAIAVEEVEIASAEWGYARTTCVGSCVFKNSGNEVRDQAQGLWVLRHTGSGWKIWRYSFSHQE